MTKKTKDPKDPRRDPRKDAITGAMIQMINFHERIRDQIREIIRGIIDDLQLNSIYLALPEFFLQYDAMVSTTHNITYCIERGCN